MVGSVTRGAMPMLPAIVTRKQAIDGADEVILRPGAELHHDNPGRGVRHEHVQQAVASRSIRNEPPALLGEIEEPALASRPDGDLDGIHATCREDQGKMERSASRRRPRPPSAGADS